MFARAMLQTADDIVKKLVGCEQWLSSFGTASAGRGPLRGKRSAEPLVLMIVQMATLRLTLGEKGRQGPKTPLFNEGKSPCVIAGRKNPHNNACEVISVHH